MRVIGALYLLFVYWSEKVRLFLFPVAPHVSILITSSVLVLTFDVVFEDRSVVILPPGHLESGAGVGLTTLVPGDDLNLATVPVLGLGDVEVPHAVVDQLVSASLKDTC